MTATLEAITQQIKDGDLDGASAALAGFPETDENRGEVAFVRGTLKEVARDIAGAGEEYEKAVEAGGDIRKAAFHAAVLFDRSGDDDHAIEYYEKCISEPPAPINAMVNLAALYEERGKLDEATVLLESVLDAFPNHARARQYLRSAESSYDMVFDEQSQRDRERRSAVLDTPIGDFELSVRSRNCLRQMNIRSLGDLLRTGETELLSYKNFGDTSLNEIKVLLEQKGLNLGQMAAEAAESDTASPLPADVSSDTSALMRRSVAELELSVRARKALQRLGITSLGELTQRSEAELMTIKNFGLTSLSEIKRQLEAAGLSLRA